MTKILLWGVGLLILLVLAAVAGLFLFAADTGREIDFRKPLLTDRPNQYLACPDGYCADAPGGIVPVFDVPADELLAAWDKAMSQEPRITAVPQANTMRRSYVQRSGLLRYPDRITVEAVPTGEGTSSLAIYSQSKYGYKDGGVNEARVNRLLARTRAALGN